jgi:peptidoglycan biosynthesis protein MviN/MurJ (putative lipid II flippase)
MAFRLTDFVNYLVAGGAISVTFIPILRSCATAGVSVMLGAFSR